MRKKLHKGGQRDKGLKRMLQNKVGMCKKKLQEEALYMARAEARRCFKWHEDQNGINANKGVPIAKIKARYMEQGPLNEENDKPCQQERRATRSSLLNM